MKLAKCIGELERILGIKHGNNQHGERSGTEFQSTTQADLAEELEFLSIFVKQLNFLKNEVRKPFQIERKLLKYSGRKTKANGAQMKKDVFILCSRLPVWYGWIGRGWRSESIKAIQQGFKVRESGTSVSHAKYEPWGNDETGSRSRSRI